MFAAAARIRSISWAGTGSLLHHRDEFVIHVPVAYAMSETVNARPQQFLGIREIEDVRDHAQIMRVGFVDDRAIHGGRQLLHGAVAIVHPDLDDVYLLRG